MGPRQLRQAAEEGASRLGIGIPGRHGHQAGEPEVRASADRVDEPGQFFRSRARLGAFRRKLHLDHHFERFSGFIKTPGEFFGIDRFDGVEQLGRQARFVGLKMADEMKLGVGQARQRGMLFRELLDVVFAEHAQAQRVRFADHRGGKLLGDRDQRDLVARSMSRASTRRLDAMLDLIDAFRRGSCSCESQAGIDAAVAGGTPWPAPSTTCKRAAAGISLIASLSSSTVPKGSRVP